MRRLLSMLLLLPLLWLPQIRAQSTASRSLDGILQDYAYRAFVNPRTGTPYDGDVPLNLTGIKIAALRLRSGSLFFRGVPSYKEFEIPTGVYEQPYVERLVLVYQNLGNWSTRYYSLSGYTYLTPVLGLLAYDASDLSAKNLKELDITASDKPILIRFTQVNSVPDGATVKCVWFNLNGLPQFSNLTSRNVCSTQQQGHFAIVVEGIVPSSAPVLPPPTGKAPPSRPTKEGGDKDNNKSKVWIIVGAVVGGFALLVLLSLLVCCLRRYKHTNKMQQMEKAAQVGEALHMTSVGDTRAPVAMGTRTQPVLENEYVP
ncbi:hypothetical protein ACHQM5_022004 [Ranunculus cassubicifolius]